ncbi:MAG: methyltransferase domain-containing protein [Emcibacteraceae bacterium]|nr:methyltransferase domain-containing protein [Emcibacteraceae bacterium]MDG1859281.1 methyltransferase domain-containing protein [Emcibacteraceae bacterium]
MTEKNHETKSKFKAIPKQNDIFNRKVLQRKRDQAAENFEKHDFLNREITLRLLDNLQDIKRDFNTILNMNGHFEPISNHFNNKTIFHQDLSLNMLKRSPFTKIKADEEFLPFLDHSLDLVFSALNLHWVNDLPGALIQILKSLKPDGLFIGAALGGETLFELRSAMMKAGIDALGGTRPHISPFMDVRDAGSLMQRAGFALPVVSTERITVTYSDAFALMKELKGMAETSCLIKGFKGLTKPSLMMKVAEHYHADHANNDGRIPVTFDILYFQGWSPHESQQKPLKPGSAKMSLIDALGKDPLDNQ